MLLSLLNENPPRAGYEEPNSRNEKIAKRSAANFCSRIQTLRTKDRCFTDDRLVFPLGEERTVMQFCREVQ